MAKIEDCSLGVRVSFNDGWGGPASVVGRRMNNHPEGLVGAAPDETGTRRNFPDIVLMRFEAPVCGGPHHKIIAIGCHSADLILL